MERERERERESGLRREIFFEFYEIEKEKKRYF